MFDNILASDPGNPITDVKLSIFGNESLPSEVLPDESVRDLYLQPDEGPVTLLTSPGILSNNDLVRFLTI